ncbi:hypothetical protein T31B1_00785 [Salinisphaera sp. T31B1]
MIAAGLWLAGAAHAEPQRLPGPVERRGPPLAIYPEIGVPIDARAEHWRGNYRPDGDRLYGYDGQPRAGTICRGDRGATWSTRAGACPPGQAPETGGRRLSTRP